MQGRVRDSNQADKQLGAKTAQRQIAGAKTAAPNSSFPIIYKNLIYNFISLKFPKVGKLSFSH